jgi:predicted nuclease with TOPRIM domain
MNLRWQLLGLVLAAFICGCNEAADRPNRPANGSATSANGADDDRTLAEKEEFERELEQDLETIDQKMARLAERIKKAEGDAKARLQQEWDELEPQRERARERLEQLKKSSGEAWKDIKAGAQSAFSELRDSVNRASERFDDEPNE